MNELPKRKQVSRKRAIRATFFISSFLPFDKNMWQRNYYEHVIRDENDYIEKAQYMLNNPLKWELEHGK